MEPPRPHLPKTPGAVRFITEPGETPASDVKSTAMEKAGVSLREGDTIFSNVFQSAKQVQTVLKNLGHTDAGQQIAISAKRAKEQNEVFVAKVEEDLREILGSRKGLTEDEAVEVFHSLENPEFSDFSSDRTQKSANYIREAFSKLADQYSSLGGKTWDSKIGPKGEGAWRDFKPITDGFAPHKLLSVQELSDPSVYKRMINHVVEKWKVTTEEAEGLAQSYITWRTSGVAGRSFIKKIKETHNLTEVQVTKMLETLGKGKGPRSSSLEYSQSPQIYLVQD